MRDRIGQWIGEHLEVLAMHRRTRRGKVLWQVLDHQTGEALHLKTSEVIALDRVHAGSTETTE